MSPMVVSLQRCVLTMMMAVVSRLLLAQAVSIRNRHNLAHTNPSRSELQTTYEKAVTDDDSDENAYKSSGISDGTYLALYTEKMARHILYQDGDNGVHDFNITKNSRRHSHFLFYLEPCS